MHYHFSMQTVISIVSLSTQMHAFSPGAFSLDQVIEIPSDIVHSSEDRSSGELLSRGSKDDHSDWSTCHRTDIGMASDHCGFACAFSDVHPAQISFHRCHSKMVYVSSAWCSYVAILLRAIQTPSDRFHNGEGWSSHELISHGSNDDYPEQSVCHRIGTGVALDRCAFARVPSDDSSTWILFHK